MDSFDRTYRSAGQAITEYAPVALDAQGRAVPAAAGAVAIGIAQRAALATERAVAVRTGGYSYATAGGAIAAGARVAAGANGTVVSATEGEVLGFADTASAASGDRIEIRIYPHAISADA